MNPSADSTESLSPRQREVLRLLAEGLSTREIAVRLGLSAKTVETHRAALMRRTGRRSVARLVLLAVREGLVQVS
jgi:DNA-binding NarL/FixJ family response regulator